MRLLASLTLGAVVAAWVVTTALTAPEEPAATPAQAATVAELVKANWPTWPGRIYEDDPRWDCHTMGNRGCGPAVSHVFHDRSRWIGTDGYGMYGNCWAEKVTSPDTAEVICGDPALRPADSVDVGTELTIDGRTWVATVTGLEPVSAN